MRTFSSKWLRVGLAVTLLLMVLASGYLPVSSARAAGVNSSGVVCTTSTSPNPSFSLTANAGMISMPDGNSIWTWSYSSTGGAFQFPGPVLCVNQGDTVTVVLNNSLPEAASIMFQGIENVTTNGFQVEPEFDGTGLMTSLVNSAPANGGTVSYSFVAANPGTYLYESGTDADKEVQMGLYGALIVRPTGHPDAAYIDSSGAAFGSFLPSTEYVMLLSEIDPALHQAVEFGQPYDTTALHPRYWLVNGRSFPDTIAPNDAAWLPAQPYSSLMHLTVADNSLPTTDPNSASQPPALVRYLDAGSKNHPFHPHGQNGRVVGRDGRPLLKGTTDLSYETFAFTIGSGQTWDQTYQFFDQEHFNPTTNPVPVTIPNQQNLTFKGNATWFSGSPYLGYQTPLPTGTTSYNQCGEFYMVMHSHALNEVANYDTSFGGMLTLERIDPLPQTQALTGLTCTQ